MLQSSLVYVSELIRARRVDKGLNQLELAERLDVARNTVIRWERAANQPTLPQRRNLARELGGEPADYEWKEDDYAHRDRLAMIKLEVNATLRRLLAGESPERGTIEGEDK